MDSGRDEEGAVNCSVLSGGSWTDAEGGKVFTSLFSIRPMHILSGWIHSAGGNQHWAWTMISIGSILKDTSDGDLSVLSVRQTNLC